MPVRIIWQTPLMIFCSGFDNGDKDALFGFFRKGNIVHYGCVKPIKQGIFRVKKR